MSNRAVVESFFASWGAQDVELTLAVCHDNIVYKLYVESDILPFGGEKRGKEACRDLLFSILADFDYLKYEPSILGVRGDTVRTQVRFTYQHRATGETLDGTRRLVFQIRDGLIVRVDGYHDARLVDAFMRLTQHRLETKQLVRRPVLSVTVQQESEVK
jgi:ketosteroid isomerase-like protein